MRAKLVVFPIRGRNWCFTRSIYPKIPPSETPHSHSPSSFKDLCSKLNVPDKPINAKAELFADYVANKMNKAWIGLENAKDGSLKKKIHGLGLWLLSRVKPSEIFLKSISKEVTGVEIIYPSSLNAQLVRRRLRHIAMRGSIIHRKYFYGSISLIPLTSALSVLPLPNVPFFWILFRTYSHWRALQGSQKLLQLVSDSSKASNTSTDMKETKDKKDSKSESHSSIEPHWVLRPSEELEHIVGQDDGHGLSHHAILKICKIYDLNTKDVIKYEKRRRARRGGAKKVRRICIVQKGEWHELYLTFFYMHITDDLLTRLDLGNGAEPEQYLADYSIVFKHACSIDYLLPNKSFLHDAFIFFGSGVFIHLDFGFTKRFLHCFLNHVYMHDTKAQLNHLATTPIHLGFRFSLKKFFNFTHKIKSQSQKKNKSSMAIEHEDELKDEKNPPPLDEDDIALLKTYGLGPYSTSIKKVEKEIKDMAKKVNDLCGIKESDTGLAAPSQWDLVSDKQMMQEEQPLQVARCTKIINPNSEDAKYVINVKQIAKFVVGLGDKVSPTDIEEGMRVGVDRNKYQIQIPLPPKIDPSVTMMTVEEKPDVTYNDVGGCKEQIEKMREVVELPMLHPEKFVKLGIDPPKGVLCYGPPGTGKTLLARAVANRTDACFIRVIGSELVQKYVGEGARMVRELFQMARSKKACIVFFDEVDAIGGARFDDGVGGDNEVQRTMLEIVNQLDGFDARGNIKVLMATNRPDTLDPALLRPGRLDRKVEFGLPDLESRTQIFKIHTRTMNCERDIRFELLARLCPNSTGADIRSVCTEAGMYAIRARRKTVTEKDFLDAVNKVIKGYQKFSATPKYMVYN
ncbi:hypothetical protein RIF29_16601 [Crotalaria pallida]|uniref:AAA+ ATPase domain-containing protein n=1 Tax=Crotalaria pallida TaxID=3830 RepID=A0AAN9IDR7_CROPI